MQHPRILGVAFLLAVVCALSAGAEVTDGLVAHWTFDEVDGSPLADVAGKHAGVVHGATPGEEGRHGTSYLFSGAADDYVDAGDGLQLPGNQATIAAVVRARAFTPSLAKGEANSRNGIFGSDNCNIFFALTDQGRVLFAWDAGRRDYQHIYTDPADAVPESRWRHVAATRDGTTMTLYVDGVVRKVQTHFSPGPFGHFDRNCIGRINGRPGRDFDGWIDDLRVYDRALSPGEIWSLAKAVGLANPILPPPGNLRRVSYNHRELVVDLSVGLYAWPLPMDYDGDGDVDLVVSCADVPYNKACFFENPGGDVKMPVFKPAAPIGSGMYNVQVSYTDGQPRVLLPAVEFENVPGNAFALPRAIPLDRNIHPNKVRANQWKYRDYDGDGD
ncbi:MAG: LamG domain-containing protein, partial [Planctomycetes bacterium]|nr:LamG domain-containing protein [Planctomycetota bacterium]